MQKFISPGSWFSLEYPEGWHEFEDTEESFLFYNPDRWTGNFRISAFQGENDAYAEACLKEELQQVSGAKRMQAGKFPCVFSSETFQDNNTWFTSYFWLIGCRSLCLECSLTVKKGESPKLGETIINTLRVYQPGERKLHEIIPVRVLEVERINESYDWAVSTLKRRLTKDFTAVEADLQNLQKLLDEGNFNPSQRQPWECIGIAFASILINEIDGMDWVTVIDGTHEYPALRFRDTKVTVEPATLIYDKIKKGQRCDLRKEYDRIRTEVEAVL